MKAVMLSIQPKWCGLIASGKKDFEIRKTKPKIETPFKCYIYCTKDAKLQFWTGKRYSYADDRSHNAFDKCGNGKVIGEFTCKEIWYIRPKSLTFDNEIVRRSCVFIESLVDYADTPNGHIYAWRISNLVIYDEPKELGAFCSPDTKQTLKRPPQSWCYVEEK